MRPDLWEPEGELTPELVADAICLVTEVSKLKFLLWNIRLWTEMERRVVFDWAMREHLAASDHRVKRRDKPYLVALTELAQAAATR